MKLAHKDLARVDPKPQGGRPEGGVRKAARDFYLETTEVHRAVKLPA